MRRTRKNPNASKQYWIGYCRKSTDSEDKQIHTLQDQTKMIQEYYATLDDRGEYPLQLLQEAQSAYRTGRPIFAQMISMADRGEVRGIIVVHPNRISRNHADSGTFVQLLVDGMIRSMNTTDGKCYTGADSNDIFMLSLEGVMSWKDSKDKGTRILKAMEARAAEGRHMGRVRVGYLTVCNPDGSRRLEMDEVRAPLILRLFQMAVTGSYSITDLQKEAKKMGLRTREGNAVNRATIHSILRDPLYKGLTRFNGKVSKGNQTPIVEEDLWNRVQVVLSGRNKNTARSQKVSLRDLFVFAGILKCPDCGRTMSPYRVRQKYTYYDCKNPDCKSSGVVSQGSLLENLKEKMKFLSIEKREMEELRQHLLKLHKEKSKNELERRGGLNAEYEKVQKEIGEMFSQRAEAEKLGIVDVVDERLKALKTRRDDLQSALNQLHDAGTEWIEKVIRSFELADILQEAIFYGSPHVRTSVLNALASNYSVKGKELMWKPRSPFKEMASKADCPEWWAIQDSNL